MLEIGNNEVSSGFSGSGAGEEEGGVGSGVAGGELGGGGGGGGGRQARHHAADGSPRPRSPHARPRALLSLHRLGPRARDRRQFGEYQVDHHFSRDDFSKFQRSFAYSFCR